MNKTEAFERIDMTGKVMTITGGGGGIGGTTARLCAARGASVVVADMDEKLGEEVVADIKSSGGKAAFIRTDVTSEDDVRAMVDFAVKTFGGLNAAFNNAGINTPNIPLTDVTLEQWNRNIAVNQTGIFLCVKYQLRHMLDNGGGAIVNNASAAGMIGSPMLVDYTAAKHGVVGITRAAASEVSSRGVRVNVIITGATETRLSADYMKDPTLAKMLMAAHPIGRIGQPRELAEAASWLMSDASSFVTGAAIAVDGGYTAQ